MSQRRMGPDGLLLWLQSRTNGYRHVNVVNFTDSWADGLAFCALLHSFHPDLIAFDTLTAGDAMGNLKLAFDVAEKLGIPRLLEPEDMLLPEGPDKFSVITYLSQFLHHFKDQVDDTVIHAPAPPSNAAAQQEEELRNTRQKMEEESSKRAKKCAKCGQDLSGTAVEVLGNTWHRKCFVCTSCENPFPDNKFVNVENKAYCQPCGKKAFNSKNTKAKADQSSSNPPDAKSGELREVKPKKEDEDELQRQLEAEERARKEEAIRKQRQEEEDEEKEEARLREEILQRQKNEQAERKKKEQELREKLQREEEEEEREHERQWRARLIGASSAPPIIAEDTRKKEDEERKAAHEAERKEREERDQRRKKQEEEEAAKKREEDDLSGLIPKTMYFKQLNKLLIKRLQATLHKVKKRPSFPKEEIRAAVGAIVSRQQQWNTPLYCKSILASQTLVEDFETLNVMLMDICKTASGDYRFEFEGGEVEEALKKDINSLNAGDIVDILLPDVTDGIILGKTKESVEFRLNELKKKRYVAPVSKFSVPLYCFEDMRLLGSGGFADVFYGKYNGRGVAIKILKSFAYTEQAVKEFDKEIQVLSSLDSPYVVKFIGANASPACMSILMEYVEGGTLQNYITQVAVIPVELKVRMAKEVALGLGVLHSRKMLHCDLKPANVLLDRDQHCKLADFGLTLVKDENTSRMTVASGTAFGTVPYMAPELFKDETHYYSVRTDVYAFGVLLYELTAQRRAYTSIISHSLVPKVMGGYREPIPDTPMQDLIARCWHADSSMRPPISAIIEFLDNVVLP